MPASLIPDKLSLAEVKCSGRDVCRCGALKSEGQHASDFLDVGSLCRKCVYGFQETQIKRIIANSSSRVFCSLVFVAAPSPSSDSSTKQAYKEALQSRVARIMATYPRV